jgi:hypothetical protein|tara:strand:+ start:5028 stop:5696 length:669 start_codon:yes stop_codon:yes gene_type:complete
MATYTVAMTSSTASLQYPATVSASQDIAVGDTISLTMTVSTNTYSQAMSLIHSAYAIAVFSLVNCTVSPSTNVRSGSTITVTPVNNNATYSCTAVITHYHASPYPPGGTTQTKTFVLSGTVGVLPIYGLEIFDANGNSRLRYDNRLCKFNSVFTGTLSGNSGTLSVPGIAADGTWGINNQAQNSIVQCFIGTNVVALNQTNFGTGGNLYGGNLNYEIIVFRV